MAMIRQKALAVKGRRVVELCCRSRVWTFQRASPYSRAFGCVGAIMQLADSHCHPQDDPNSPIGILEVKAATMAVMGVQEADWAKVEHLYRIAPDKVIPCFGVHPWYAHLHGLPDRGCTEIANILDVPPNQDQTRLKWLMELKPSLSWEAKLRALLQQYPHSVVGEFGLDRAAVIPTTRVQVNFEHQLRLAQIHLKIAAEYNRPVSMHCVRSYGHLNEMLRTMQPDEVPSKVMLHSFGGNPEVVSQFTKLPKGIGKRIYFSFSTVINGNNMAKLAARIKAVPDDRFLIESDQNTPAKIDAALESIVQVVSEAKGWTQEETACRAMANFRDFFGSSIASAGA